MESEHEAYHALVADGGRPSHPLDLLKKVLAAPGKYRDILTFWQDRPDEWQVFTKQLRRWNDFRYFQLLMRQTYGFDGYAGKLEAYLTHRQGFKLPGAFMTPAGGLSQDPRSQGELATWIEYLLFEYSKRHSYRCYMEKHEPRYREAWATLLKSGVLRRSEMHEDVALEICTPSSIAIARRMYEKRRTGYKLRGRPKAPPNETQLQRLAPKARRRLEIAWRKCTEIKKKLELMEHRDKQIAEFRGKTHAYRLAKDKLERHDALLRWALDQVPRIAEDMDRDRPSILPSIETDEIRGKKRTPTVRCTFRDFPRLPAELRHIVWTNCLPPRPTAHFFEVLNHPRKRHMAQHWSSSEFRVCATTEHDSGYRVIYSLLAVCQESRIIIANHYKRLQQSPDPLAWQFPFPVFQDCNWIPPDDLIILCFPPKQAPLPEKHAVTFSSGPARKVGIYFPKEMLLIAQFGVEDEGTGRMLRYRDNIPGIVDDESQIPMIPEFLDRLCRDAGLDDPEQQTAGPGKGGIKKLHVLYEGWRTWDCHVPEPGPWSSMKSLEACRDRGHMWRFDAARENESVNQWCKLTSLCRAAGEPLCRGWWWLASGSNAVAGWDAYDVAERTPGRLINECRGVMERGCRVRGWSEFEGGDVLGWIL